MENLSSTINSTFSFGMCQIPLLDKEKKEKEQREYDNSMCTYCQTKKRLRERERERGKGIAKIHDEKKEKKENYYFLDKCFELSWLCMKFLMRK